MIAGKANDAFHKMLMIRVRKFENDDVTALQLAIRKKFLVPGAGAAENKLIHQQMVADQQSLLHRWRRNLEGLYDKRSSKQGENYGDQKRFQIFGNRGGVAVRVMRARPSCCGLFRHAELIS